MEIKIRKHWLLGCFVGVTSLFGLLFGDDSPPPAPSGGPSTQVISQQNQGGSNAGSIAPAGSADNFLFTGSFLYNVPLGVPPGIAGMQPELSLNYNSSGGNSWIGTGWDLSLGTIQRSTKNGVPHYDATDTFVFTLKGQTQELVKIPDGTYRAKIEGAFLKFVLNTGGWTVSDKTGTVFRFGQTTESRIAHPSNGQIFLWALDNVTDRNGNYMTINYAGYAADNQLYADRINYTGNAAAGQSLQRKVTFVREPRPDIVSNARAGFMMITRYRLANVQGSVLVNNAWELVRDYALAYLNRTVTQRSLLSSVQMTGYSNGTNKSVVIARFDYPSEQHGWGTELSAWALPENLSLSPDGWIPTQAQFVDLNSDGRPDFVSAFDTGGGWTHYSWINTGTGWNEVPAWRLPENLAFGPTFTPTNATFPDLNGDGRPDFVIGLEGGPHRAWLNTGAGWQEKTELAPPNDIGMATGANPGARMIDLNGDHRADCMVAFERAGEYRKTWINNGNGWELSAQWRLPENLALGSALEDNAAELIDLNGDGLPDFVFGRYGYASRTWINTGNGWNESTGWALPDNLGFGGNKRTGRLVDLNGDGLPDFVTAYNNGGDHQKAWINTGSGWLPQNQWIPPANFILGANLEQPTNAMFMDVNGDGLVDFVYSYSNPQGTYRHTWLNTGNGWADAPLWIPPENLGLSGKSPGAMIADLNGDQMADFMIANPTPKSGGGWTHRTWLANAQQHNDVISGIRNHIGGATRPNFDTSVKLSNRFLPFAAWVVSNIQSDDGRGNTLRTDYAYAGGYYDINLKEFLGFSRVDTLDVDGNKSSTYFLQETDASGNAAPQNAYKGRAKLIEQYDAAGHLLTSQRTQWEFVTPSSGVYFVRAKNVLSTTYDTSPSLSTQVDLYYDDAPGAGYGNVVRTVNQGDIAVNGDTREELVDYAANAGAYLVGFPQYSVTKDGNGNKLTETKYFYDGSSTLGAISRGNVTKVSRLLNPGNRWIDVNTAYDALGRVTDVEDARHNHVQTTYDAYGFPATVTNALGHVVRSTYDPRTGNVLSDTDINNQVTTYGYDALGRATKVVGPLDSDAYPTSTTDFHDELLGNPNQQYIQNVSRVRNGQPETMWSRRYFDGLGRGYKSEQSELGTNTILTETLFNSRGLTWKTSVPRPASPPTTPLWNENTYDALGRVVQSKRPDGAITYTTYQGRTTSVQDPNGNIQSSLTDAYGRVIKRYEPSIANPTQYAYDILGRLTGVTDSQGKISSFFYDSFGRKIQMVDPNAGTWNYSYDDNGNLATQTDARLVQLTFQYDALNRIKQKTLAADPKVVTGQTVGVVLSSYTYDSAPTGETAAWPNEKGRLTIASDPSGESRFYHDKVGRMVKEMKWAGVAPWYSTLTGYDALDRVTQITYPNNQIVKYVYDAAGRLSQVTSGDGAVTYASYPSYNALGQPLLRYQNGGLTRTTYQYHPTRFVLNRLLTETNVSAGPSQKLQDASYTFDPAGNITRIADALHADRTQNFTYDSLYRLTRAQGVYGDDAFTYDNLGNFQTKDQTTYRYLDPAHPYAVTETFPTNKPATDGSTLLAWDLDPSEPIYSISGTVKRSNGVLLSSVSVVLSGGFDQAVFSDTQGRVKLRGIAGAPYSVSVSSTCMVASPLGYAYNPLSANIANADFTLSPDPNPPLDPTKLRIPRTVIAAGLPTGVQGSTCNIGGSVMASGVMLGDYYGGLELSSGAYKSFSGYSPLQDGADSQYQQPAQYQLPPGATTYGVLGPDFVTGRYHKALTFNGITDLFAFPNTVALNPSNLTLMIWVKPAANPSFGTATLIAKSSASALGDIPDGFRVAMNTAGKVAFEIGAAGGSTVLTSSQTLKLNKWTFVTATYDGAQMKLYLNGVQDATRANTNPLLLNGKPATLAALLTTTNRTATGSFFYGTLDDPRIHNRAWTSTEIMQAYSTFLNAATYSYDDNGNLKQKSAGDITWTYGFDAEGRLACVKQNTLGTSTTTPASFIYDGAGARVKKITADGTNTYVNKLFELRSDGSQVTHIFAGSDLICDLVKPASSPTQPYYIHGDHLGSVTLITDATGHLTEETVYTPFGETYSSEGDSPLTRKYTGQEIDDETGLYYYQARYYDPVLGRFVSADTIVPGIGDPQNLNRYVYCRNNPVIMIDNDGHIAWFIPVIAAAVMAGTHGEPFDRHSWSYFDFKAAVIAGASAYVGGWAYGVAGGGFGGSIIAGALSGITGGGLGAAIYGGDIMASIGQGFAAGMVSGIVSGSLASIPIHVGQTGLVQSPIPSLAGSYISTLAMGGGKSAAEKAARYAFEQGALSNTLGFAYDKGTGFKNGPNSGSTSNKAYLMSRPLEVPVLGKFLAIFGIGHLAITNGETTKELFPYKTELGREGQVNLISSNENSFKKFGNSFGTTYQPLATGYSEYIVPTQPSSYNMIFHNSNTAIYNLMGTGK